MSDAPWYRRWFGTEYLELYAHRDREEARRAVALVDGLLSGESLPADWVLDLACGGGRHLEELAARGYRALGLDLSPELLAHARGELPDVPLLRGDMRRIPLATGSQGAVTSFFTSFGYFEDPADDERVLTEVRRVLAAGGWFVLDFLNAQRVRAHLEPRDERLVDGVRVVQERRLVEGGRRVEKRIELGNPGTPGHGTFRERVRLYSREELEGAMRRCGMEPVAAFGDYHGGPYEPEAQRLLLAARTAPGGGVPTHHPGRSS